MVSTAILWYDVTKSFFAIISKLKKKAILNVCVRRCFLLRKKLLNVMIGYLIFEMDCHLIDPTWYETFLKQN